uniref:Uncharacterized protein n=1 Tax=Siphoviridae sp. ct9UA16 TaxID=2827793 RepID=A0A8S5TMM5_9CAUD|nr:MAG TPA: hypothetical protein [Siphoviridae sp. ct9UA16]
MPFVSSATTIYSGFRPKKFKYTPYWLASGPRGHGFESRHSDHGECSYSI